VFSTEGATVVGDGGRRDARTRSAEPAVVGAGRAGGTGRGSRREGSAFDLPELGERADDDPELLN